MKAWYRVRSPEGYVALELAEGAYDARRRAAKRPGYTPEDALQVELYKPYIYPVPDAARMRAGIALYTSYKGEEI